MKHGELQWRASCVNSSICCSPLRSPRPIRGIKDGDWCLESILYCELGGDTTTNMFSTLAIVSRLKDLITFFCHPWYKSNAKFMVLTKAYNTFAFNIIVLVKVQTNIFSQITALPSLITVSYFKYSTFRPALQLLLLPSLKPRLRQILLFCMEDMYMVLVMGMLV